MVPPEHKDSIIFEGISFMRAITLAYGAEEGMKLWATIADTLDPEIKGAIFFTMLTGGVEGYITVTSFHGTDFVYFIKAIRTLTGKGLKEAKDDADLLRGTGKQLQLKLLPGISRRDAVLKLKETGATAR